MGVIVSLLQIQIVYYKRRNSVLILVLDNPGYLFSNKGSIGIVFFPGETGL